jgi:ABC-type nitrate/sulfonate/bicarbonate transport system permease component
MSGVAVERRPAIRTRRRVTFRANPLGLATLAALIGLWQLVFGAGIVHVHYLPTPVDVFRGGRDLLSSGDLVHNGLHTLVSTVLGWFIGLILGLILGLAVGLVPVVWRYCMASFELLRAVPGVTLAPLAVLIFGLSTRMELVLIVFVAVWPILISTVAGVRSANPARLEMARSLRMSRVRTIRAVILPGALPEILVAMRISLALALALAVVAEIVGNPDGIGYALVSEQDALQPGRMFAYIVLAGLIGIALNAVVVFISRLLWPGAMAVMDRSEGM